MAWRRGQSYSQDLRDRVLAASGSIREVAQRLEVSESYVAHARGRLRRLGLDTPGEQRNHVAPHLAAVEKALAAQVAAKNDQRLQDLVEWAREQPRCANQHHCDVEHAAPAGADAQKKSLRASEQQRPDVAAQRRVR